MDPLLEGCEYFGGLDDIDQLILGRASARLSEILPRRLRFSEAWQARKEQALREAGRIASKGPHGPPGAASFRGGAGSCALKVYVRLRPLHVKAASHLTKGSHAPQKESIMAVSDQQLRLLPPQNAKRVQGGGLKPLPSETLSFTHVFGPTTSQQSYFQGTTEALVQDLVSFKARSSVVMAYGSSGAGKTYSIEGPLDDPGLLPRALRILFEQLAAQQAQAAAGAKAAESHVLVSYYEVYNDVVYDLLDGVATPPAPQGPSSLFSQPDSSWGGGAAGTRALMHALLAPQQPQRKALRVREDARGRVLIPGLLEVPCGSAEAAVDLQRKGARSRQQAATGVNATSSRSHCVFTVRLAEGPAPPGVQRVQGAQPGAPGVPRVRTAALSFVDLAGSERAGRTKNAGERLRESASINGSLMCLGRCLEVLKQNQSAPPGAPQRVLPFRESKITHLFKDTLHGWGHLVLAVSVSPSAEDFEESHHVLRYAALATAIALAPIVPQEGGPGLQATNEAEAGGAEAVVSGAKSVAALQTRVGELEGELERVCAQLAEAEAALGAAEADIRDEVVGEIQDVIKELRGSYEERVSDMARQLEAKDAELASRDESLEAVQRELAERDARIRALEAQLAAAGTGAGTSGASLGPPPPTSAQVADAHVADVQETAKGQGADVRSAGAVAGNSSAAVNGGKRAKGQQHPAPGPAAAASTAADEPAAAEQQQQERAGSSRAMLQDATNVPAGPAAAATGGTEAAEVMQVDPQPQAQPAAGPQLAGTGLAGEQGQGEKTAGSKQAAAAGGKAKKRGRGAAGVDCGAGAGGPNTAATLVHSMAEGEAAVVMAYVRSGDGETGAKGQDPAAGIGSAQDTEHESKPEQAPRGKRQRTKAATTDSSKLVAAAAALEDTENVQGLGQGENVVPEAQHLFAVAQGPMQTGAVAGVALEGAAHLHQPRAGKGRAKKARGAVVAAAPEGGAAEHIGQEAEETTAVAGLVEQEGRQQEKSQAAAHKRGRAKRGTKA